MGFLWCADFLSSAQEDVSDAEALFTRPSSGSTDKGEKSRGVLRNKASSLQKRKGEHLQASFFSQGLTKDPGENRGFRTT